MIINIAIAIFSAVAHAIPQVRLENDAPVNDAQVDQPPRPNFRPRPPPMRPPAGNYRRNMPPYGGFIPHEGPNGPFMHIPPGYVLVPPPQYFHPGYGPIYPPPPVYPPHPMPGFVDNPMQPPRPFVPRPPLGRPHRPGRPSNRYFAPFRPRTPGVLDRRSSDISNPAVAASEESSTGSNNYRVHSEPMDVDKGQSSNGELPVISENVEGSDETIPSASDPIEEKYVNKYFSSKGPDGKWTRSTTTQDEKREPSGWTPFEVPETNGLGFEPTDMVKKVVDDDDEVTSKQTGSDELDSDEEFQEMLDLLIPDRKDQTKLEK